MKQKSVIRTLCASLVLASSVSAQAASGLVEQPFGGSTTTVNFVNGMSGFTGELSFTYGMLAAMVPGTVKYTFLGSEAGYTNYFGTSSTVNFENHGVSSIGANFSQNVTGIGAPLDFRFSTSTVSPAYTVANGQPPSPSGYGYGPDQGVFGIVGPTRVGNVAYDSLLIYNDPVAGGDHDYNDMVIGVNFTAAVPEPETYAMLLAGLGLLGAVARRRKQQPIA